MVLPVFILKGRKMQKSIGVALLLAMSCSAYSQTNDEVLPHGWEYSIHVGSASIDSETAVQEGIKDSALAIGIFADYRQNGWLSRVGLDMFIYDDNEEFEQIVEGQGVFNDGDISTESSDAQAFALSAATGYEFRFGENNASSVSLLGGFTAMVSSERSITDCTNCFSEDIDVDGGVFVAGTLSHDFESFGMGLHVRQYIGGDGLDSIIGLQIHSVF
jgi:hypothetical protein